MNKELTLDLSQADLERLRRKSADTIRGLAMDAVQKARSGHPGMPMGMADAAVVLWTHFLKHNPANPQWMNRDRFVLSAGHGSMLLYSLLYLTGYDVSLEDLRHFRQWDSKTPGHPELHLTPGVETTTGPLGQGISTSVGMALAERHLAARFNRPDFPLIDHYTYVLCSDGDLMEGVSHEACSLAGHLRLSRLIVLYDDNGISIDGPTALSFSEDVLKRFKGYGWHVQRVDGHDINAVARALDAARAETGRPSLIACKTHIAYPSPNKQDTAAAHGEPLGEEEIRLTKEVMNWPQEPFHVPDDVLDFMRQTAGAGARQEAEWESLLERYAEAHPEPAEALRQIRSGDLPEGWDADLPDFPVDKPVATRVASGKVLEALMPRIPALLAGSADLTPSNKTKTKEAQPLSADDYAGRYVHYGVREHGMGCIMNGLALHGLRPFGGTFLIFSDYMRPAVRLAAIMELPTLFVYTHDSIGLGEDGPTHQPVEHLASLRAIPNLRVFRPADATETLACWRAALLEKRGPSALVLTRQDLPILDRSRYAPLDGVYAGAYVLADVEDPQVILIASGSEVTLALEARQRLAEGGVRARVVSMPCTELFEEQEADYKAFVLPPHLRARVAVEAGAKMGLERYVGLDGEVVGMNSYGASAPYQTIYERLGLTPDAVVDAAQRVLETITRPAS